MNPMTWGAPFPIVAGALFVIVMFRANGTYWLGRALASGAERTRYRALLQSPAYLRASNWLARWGAPAVSVSFLTIGIQTLVNLSAGATRMPLRRYLPAVTIGCIMWAVIYATVGFIGWNTFAILWEKSPVLTAVLGVVLVAALVAWVGFRIRDSRRSRVAEAN